MIPVILEVLRSGTPSAKKDTVEYSFRRVLIDVIHRIPLSEIVRPQAVPLLQGMLHLIRTDNEEVGVICCKVTSDVIRAYKPLTEELAADAVKLYKEIILNMDRFTTEYLSEGSKPLESNEVLMGIRSCKVAADLGYTFLALVQSSRNGPHPIIQEVISLNLHFLALESPAQKKIREDYEAMGNVWVGVSPKLSNVAMHTDFMASQAKVSHYTKGKEGPSSLPYI